MGLQVSHGVHSEVGGIQCGGIHQGEECNLDCPELSGTETPFDREEFLSARLFRFHGGDGQTIRAGIHLAAGAGGAAFGGAEHGVGASAAFRRLLTGPFEGLTEISPRLCRGSFNWQGTGHMGARGAEGPWRYVSRCSTGNWHLECGRNTVLSTHGFAAFKSRTIERISAGLRFGVFFGANVFDLDFARGVIRSEEDWEEAGKHETTFDDHCRPARRAVDRTD